MVYYRCATVQLISIAIAIAIATYFFLLFVSRLPLSDILNIYLCTDTPSVCIYSSSVTIKHFYSG